MNSNNIERALDSVSRMIQARAALQTILRGDYKNIVSAWINAIKEAMRNTGKSPVEVLCMLSEKETSGMILLGLLAATLEIIEEEAR